MVVDPAPNAVVTIGRVRFGNALPLALIAGPCALESRAHALEMASALRDIARRLDIGLVFKTSFDKANRTSAASPRGLGLDKAIPIFAEIRETLGLPVLTDVHEPDQCAWLAGAVDAVQIPAFLCRQTDLLVAAALRKSPAPATATCSSPSAARRSATTPSSPTCARCRSSPRPARR